MATTTPDRVRLHAFTTGSMTSDYSGLLDGEAGSVEIPVPVFVIEHPNALVVVDAGLHPDLATSSARLGPLATVFTPHLDPDQSLGPLLTGKGFDPAAVGVAILTHLHFDHAGGLLEVPNARVVVQQREWAGLDDEALTAMRAYNPGDVDLGHDRQELDGDHDLFGDGTVTCLLTDGHTAGHQSVRVRAHDATYVICGDCCYLRRSLDDEHLPPFGHDRNRQLASMRRLGAEQTAGATLVFGHDPEQFERIGAEGLHPGV